MVPASSCAERRLMVKRSNGDGSVYFRASDQRWCATLSLPSPDGKQRRVTRTVPAKGTGKQQEAAAKAKLIELRRERDKNGGDIETATLNVATWMRKWLRDVAGPEARPKTAASYRTTVEQYIVPSIGRKQLKKLTPDDVRTCIKYVTEKGLSSRSAALTYQVLALGLKAAYREGKVTRIVTDLVNRPRTKKTELTVLSADDGIKVLQAVSGWPPPLAVDRLRSRWAAALLTGARQGELLGLTWDRVDFLNGTIDLSWQLQRVAWQHGCGGTCNRKRAAECPKRRIDAPADWEHKHITGGLWWSRPKSHRSVRLIPLVQPLYGILEARQKQSVQEDNPHKLVWTQPNGSPIDPSRDNAAWHDVLKLAGVQDARLHDARHTTVDLLYQAEVPEAIIQEIVGHSVVSVTRGYKSRGNHAQLQDAMKRMSALMIEAH